MAKTFQQRIDSATSGAVRDTETPGLYVRVGVRSRTWNYFRFGKPRRSLGRYPDVSIAEAGTPGGESEGEREPQAHLHPHEPPPLHADVDRADLG
jgi:hypothetical protein